MIGEASNFMICKPCGCVVAVMIETMFNRKEMARLLKDFPDGLIVRYVDDDYIHTGEWITAGSCPHRGRETPGEFLTDIGIDAGRINQVSVGDRMVIRDALKAAQS